MANKSNKEEFTEKSILAHNYCYDYSAVIYINAQTKVSIICKEHGIFNQSPSKHLSGRGCPKCKIKKHQERSTKSTSQFISESQQKHNLKYSYEKTIYVHGKDKVIITCSHHGDFKQTPNAHLRGNGCPKCHTVDTVNRLTLTSEQFKERAKIKHNETYIYDKVKYITSKDKVEITCKTHGSFWQTPTGHIMGRGCGKCKGDKCRQREVYSQEEFISKVSKVHNYTYDYSKVNYIDNRTPVIIGCPVHGDFEQTPNNHTQGSKCPNCAKESHWRRSEYIKKANGRLCTFYILRCYSTQEKFYKIGMTMNTVKLRYCDKNSMPYDYEVLSQIKGEAGEIWDLELAEKRKLKQFKYQPLMPFDGSKTECFTEYKIN